jgi:hypothetical protein
MRLTNIRGVPIHDWLIEGTCKPTFAGLVYDIAGVTLLVLALAAVRTETIQAQSSTGYGGANKDLYKALILQRHDARFGLPLLVIGFTMQAAGAHDAEVLWPCGKVLVLPLAVILACYLLSRWRIARDTSLELRAVLDGHLDHQECVSAGETRPAAQGARERSEQGIRILRDFLRSTTVCKHVGLASRFSRKSAKNGGAFYILDTILPATTLQINHQFDH